MDLRVVCTQKAETPRTTHTHIVRVGTGTEPTKYEKLWTEPEVIQAMRQGHRFYTVSPSTGKTAWVVTEYCSTCARTVLRTLADSVTDNNLNNLPICS